MKTLAAMLLFGNGGQPVDRIMNDIYAALRRIADTPGACGVLAQVESTDGSSPRKAGARMLLSPDGLFSGTVGGGTLEYRAQCEARALLGTGQELTTKTYSLGSGEGESIGSICGGSATLSFRLIDPEKAADLIAERPPRPRVLLYGAGHVGKALADALALLDIPVIVTDERAPLLTPERFPSAERRCCPCGEAPMDPGPEDMIVIMTHGHAWDYALLRRAMDTDAPYIGVMASRKKALIFRERLLDEGVLPERIEQRLHSPIGLFIGAQTPEEIAVSVAAELIAFLRR